MYPFDSHQPPLPTHYWSGSYSYPVMFKLNPAIPPGRYKMMAGLYVGPHRAELNPGPGTVADNQHRYQIGTLTITPDTTPPEFIDSSLTNGAKVQGTAEVKVRARDLDRVSRMELEVDGQLVAAVAADKLRVDENDIVQGQFSWDTATVSSAIHKLAIKVVDPSGNATNRTINLEVNNPVVYLATPSTPTAVPGGQVQLIYHWSGGPLPFPANVLTLFVAPKGNQLTPQFAFNHTPQPALDAWTGGEVTDKQSISVPANTPAGTYQIVVILTSSGGPVRGKLMSISPGPGVEVLDLANHKFCQIGSLTVTPERH